MTKHDKRKFPSDDDLLDVDTIYQDRLLAARREVTLLEEFARQSADILRERMRYNQEHETRLRLEKRLRERGARMHEIEECRVFEAETERLLVDCLDSIFKEAPIGTAGYWHASRALDQLADRKGPRS